MGRTSVVNERCVHVCVLLCYSAVTLYNPETEINTPSSEEVVLSMHIQTTLGIICRHAPQPHMYKYNANLRSGFGSCIS